MAITFPAAYSAKLHSSSLEVDWLFHFVNNNAGYVYLASKDRTVGANRYYGVVEESGEITRELDLLNCVASVGELSISCADVYKTGTLSGELLHNGTDYYINQEVKIYECANNETTLANCPLLYSGRLKEIDIQGNGVVLVIEQWTPFDHITIPNSKDSVNGVYAPVIYGNYTKNNQVNTFQDKRTMWPAPATINYSTHRYFAVNDIHSNTLALHFYEETIDEYCNLYDFDTEDSSVQNGINAVKCDFKLRRLFNFRPDGHDSSDFDDTNEWGTSPTQGYNGNTGNFCQSATMTTTVAEGSEGTDYVLMLPQIEGRLPDFTVYVYNVITVSEASADGSNLAELEVSIDGGSTWTQINTRTTVGATTAAWDNTGDISTGATMQMPEKLIIRLTNTAVGGTGQVVSYGRVMDVYIYIQTRFDEYDRDADRRLKEMPAVYVGTDGFDKDYTDGSGAAREIHEAHRDIMDRFGGVDFADANMDGWSDLDTARSSWQLRMWELSPRSLKEVLEQLQFEGCFIFMLVADADGSGNAGGRYIWVQNTYAAGDVIQTFNEDDYTNLSIGHTDVYEIITRTKYQYNREPRNNNYQQEEDFNNTTDRDLWNLGTTHYEEIDLDYLTQCTNGINDIYDGDTTPNESIVLYRDNLQSEPKILVDCEMTNKKKSNVEYGDIIKFNDSNVLPYGDAWADLYFMVISERRTKTGLSITAKEVYRV